MTMPRLLLAVLFFAPALMGAIHAGRLAAACWITGAFGSEAVCPDPLVTRIRGDDGQLVPRKHADRYERASELAPFDYRYPDRLARSILKSGRGETNLVYAHVLHEEAVRRLPCYVIPRLLLAASTLELGQTALAESRMISALSLAPIWQETSRNIEEFFERREEHGVTRSDRERKLLSGVLRLPTEAGDRIAIRLLSHELMISETVYGALADASVDPARGVDLLLRSERWPWVEDYAARHGRMLEGAALLACAEVLLRARTIGPARTRAERAREVMGDGFDGWAVLARCRFAGGDSAGGLAAVGSALDTGLDPEEATGILTAGRVPGGRQVSFWSAWIDAGDDRPRVRLELARALVGIGRGLEATSLLDDLGELEGETSFLRARMFLAEGKPKMALQHAERALRFEPRNVRFRDLRDRLRKVER